VQLHRCSSVNMQTDSQLVPVSQTSCKLQLNVVLDAGCTTELAAALSSNVNSTSYTLRKQASSTLMAGFVIRLATHCACCDSSCLQLLRAGCVRAVAA
jgi:hypothetical protein